MGGLLLFIFACLAALLLALAAGFTVELVVVEPNKAKAEVGLLEVET